MSWTLVRHKNGQEVPIRVSVLDAFRSGSKRDKRPAEASHIVRSKANTKATVTPKSQGIATTTTNSWSTSEPETWTEEDDNILRKLKTSNTPWKQILAALGDKHISESQMKARWKEIEGKTACSTAGVDANEKNKKEEEKKAKAEKVKAEGLAKQAAVKEGKVGKKERKGILKSNSRDYATSQENDLKSVAAKYDKDKWLAVASRHFDRTGQRISPEMAREMCGATN